MGRKSVFAVKLLGIAVLFALVASGAQAQSYWAKTYGGVGEDSAKAVVETSDGGIAVAGGTSSFGPAGQNMGVLKLNSLGVVEWEKAFGGGLLDVARSVRQTSDGGFMVAGITESFAAGNYDWWLLKLDAAGAVVGQKTFGGALEEEAYSVRQNSDGSFAVAGYTASYGAGNYDLWVLKMDVNGSIDDSFTFINDTSVTGASTSANALGTSASVTNTSATVTTSALAAADTAAIINVQGAALLPAEVSPPGSPAPLEFTNATTLQWENLAEADTFNLYRGYIHELKQGEYGSCAQSGITNNWTADNPPFPPTWAKTYGGALSDSASSMVQTADGGFAVAGNTMSFGVESADFWVTKLGAVGNVAWQKAYGGATYDEATSIVQSSDGGFAAAGISQSLAGDIDFLALKLDASGVVQWQKIFGGAGDDPIHSIIQTSDGSLVVAGGTQSYGAGNHDFWVLKLNASGVVEWQKTYGGAMEESANAIIQTADGGFAVAGSTSSFGAGNFDSWVLKLDASGVVQWQKAYGGTSFEGAYAVAQTADGGFAVAGFTNSFGAGYTDFWVLKLDASGVVEWQKTYGGAGGDYPRSFVRISDGGFAAAGYTDSFGAGIFDIWVLKLDASGVVLWQKTFGDVGLDEAYAMVRTANGGFAVAGGTDSFGAGGYEEGNYDFWVLQLDNNGKIAASCSLVSDTAASVADTNATVTGTAASVADTTATATDTSATVTTTAASTAEQCGGVFTEAAWFYLVSGENASGEGTLGNDSSGAERVNGNPCP